MIALVAALDREGLIGVGGRLPWHLPADMAHFRSVTRGRTVIMGRKTHDSIGGPLKGRTNLVLSHMARRSDSAYWYRTLGDALAHGISDVYVIGGASVYAQALPLADRLYLTRIAHTFPAGEGAVYFPSWDGFWLVAETKHDTDAANPYAMTFQTWERRR